MIFPFPEAPGQEPEEPKVDRRKKNSPEEFKRNGYRGLAWCDSHDDALKKARYLRMESGVSVRTVVVNPNSDSHDPRHLLMVPSDTDGETAELLQLWLENFGELEASQTTHSLSCHSDVSSFTFKSGGMVFQGFVIAKDKKSARELAMRMKRELGIPIRCKNYPTENNLLGYLVMVPANLDSAILNIAHLWLKENR